MTMDLHITEAGRQAVETRACALFLRDRLAKFHAEGTPEDIGTAMAVAWIVWVLTGHDLRDSPEDTDNLALAKLAHEHAAEINGIAGRIEARCRNYDELKTH